MIRRKKEEIPVRLFVAIRLDDRMKDVLCRQIEAIRPHTKDARFSRRENLHLTLSFIGETGRVAQAKRALHRVQAEPFVISTAEVGRFRRSTGDILWTGLAKNPQLEALAQQVRQKLEQEGFVLEKRPFAAHLTLGREVLLEDGFDLTSFSKSCLPEQMPVERVSLMKSERQNGRLVYTEVDFVVLNKNKQEKW